MAIAKIFTLHANAKSRIATAELFCVRHKRKKKLRMAIAKLFALNANAIKLKKETRLTLSTYTELV